MLVVYSSLINPTDELVCTFALLNRRRRTEVVAVVVVVVVVWAKRIILDMPYSSSSFLFSL